MKRHFNDTTLFLVPCLGKDVDELVAEFGFVNSYLKEDISATEFEGVCIYLLFKPDPITKIQRYIEEEYAMSRGLIADYDYEGGFVVLVYSFPTEFEKDLNRFLKGKFSKFSAAFKGKLPSMTYEEEHGIQVPVVSLQHKIVNKAEVLRNFWQERMGAELPPDAECWSKPDMKRETLTLAKLNAIKN